MRKHFLKLKISLQLLVIAFLATGCYVYKWNDASGKAMVPAPKAIAKHFNNGAIELTGVSPSDTYKYETAEKDKVFSKDKERFHFNNISIALKDEMPEGKVLADIQFKDLKGNIFKVNDFDLMRITPTLDNKGDLLYPELLLEEFNRFGVGLRREFKEFSIEKSDSNSDDDNSSMDNAYRVSVVNGCLDTGKWEFSVTSEDYSDFNERVKNPVNFNQNKVLAHTWFLVPKELYGELIKYKNPNVKFENIDLSDFSYEEVKKVAQTVDIDFSKLRNPIKKDWNAEVLEIGHKANKPIELLDLEEHFKVEYGLLVGYDHNSLSQETYKTILDPSKQPLKFAQFRDEGFYSPETALTFDVNWLSHLDDITLKSIDNPGSECFVQIEIQGKWAPYKVTIGNIDLTTLQEQKLYGYNFGFNVYPKGRRYNPQQPTITFDEDLAPENLRRYVLLTDSKTGKWVDNFHKGLGKVFLSYSTLEKDVLDVYLISYERIAPLWSGKIKLPRELREKVRIRKQLYNY